jgi:hypothetical protein
VTGLSLPADEVALFGRFAPVGVIRRIALRRHRLMLHQEQPGTG